MEEEPNSKKVVVGVELITNLVEVEVRINLKLMLEVEEV